MDSYTGNNNNVDIMITAPSDIDASPSSSDEIYSDDDEHCESLNETSDTNDKELKEEQSSDDKEDKASREDEEKLCDDLRDNLNVNDEKPAHEEKESSAKNGEQKYEIVGDRVLVEIDGKFELVDANEIKAEYFEMCGLKSEESSVTDTTKNIDISHKGNEVEGVRVNRERPKTTPALYRGNRETQQRSKRAQSSWGSRNTSEYDRIRSRYGLSDEQLENKRKREEAIARRKKKEKELEAEEEKRKREDAERAFQAWIQIKKAEAKERRRELDLNNEGDENKSEESEKAFKSWVAEKKKQQKVKSKEDKIKMQEEASTYVVHDRDSCEDAFKGWLKKKKHDKKIKESEKKKKQRPKSRRKHKEALPINSDKIRFTDNYGYRNAVVY